MVSFTVFIKINSVTVSSSTKNLWQLDQLSRLSMRRRKSLVVWAPLTYKIHACQLMLLQLMCLFSRKKREREREREGERDQKFNSRPSISFTFDFSFCCNDYLLFSSKDIKKIQAISSGELLWRQKSISLLLTLTNSLLI